MSIPAADGPNGQGDQRAVELVESERRYVLLLDGVRVGPGVSLVNVVADVGAQISGGSRRGSDSGVTLIGEDGAVAATEDFDRSARLPAGY